MAFLNKKQKGYILFFLSRGPFATSILIILIPLILDLTKYNSDSQGNVDYFIFHIKPSVVVVITNSITCLSILLLSPVLGIVSDMNNVKSILLRILIYFCTLVTFMSALLLKKSLWWLGALIQILSLTAFESSYVLGTSYISEIALDRKTRSLLASWAVIAENLSVVLFLLVIPVVLRHENPRNLITRGNFDLHNSYQSWNLKVDNDVIPCTPRAAGKNDLFFEPRCWWQNNLSIRGKARLEIFVPKRKEVSLFQSKQTVNSLFAGRFQFSTTASVEYKKKEEVFVMMIVNQTVNSQSPLIAQKLSKTFVLDTTERFMKTKVNIEPSVEFLTFEIKFWSDDDTTVNIGMIETSTNINTSYILIMLFSVVWYCVVSHYAVSMIDSKKDRIAQADKRGKTLSFDSIKSALLIMLHDTDAMQFIFGNIFWNGGLTIFNTLIIIYMEDKFSLTASTLAAVFCLTCINIVIGAILSYKLERLINQWNTALIFYSLWLLNPIIMLIFNQNSVFTTSIFSIIFGISMGVILSLKYSIFSNLVPLNHEGEYMGIFYFCTKLVDFLANMIVMASLQLFDFSTVLLMSALMFMMCFLILLPMILRKRKNIIEQNLSVDGVGYTELSGQ